MGPLCGGPSGEGAGVMRELVRVRRGMDSVVHCTGYGRFQEMSQEAVPVGCKMGRVPPYQMVAFFASDFGGGIHHVTAVGVCRGGHGPVVARIRPQPEFSGHRLQAKDEGGTVATAFT